MRMISKKEIIKYVTSNILRIDGCVDELSGRLIELERKQEDLSGGLEDMQEAVEELQRPELSAIFESRNNKVSEACYSKMKEAVEAVKALMDAADLRRVEMVGSKPEEKEYVVGVVLKEKDVDAAKDLFIDMVNLRAVDPDKVVVLNKSSEVFKSGI